MKIDVLGSSSSGNCYIIEDQGQKLILEAGVHIMEIKKALNFDIHDVAGCLVSHIHMDHSKSMVELMNLGINVGSGIETMQNIDHHRKNVLEPQKLHRIGNFTVMPFEIDHDVKNFGYVIKCPSGKKILFATDTQFLMHRFEGINIYMLECNFDMDSMRKAVKCGKLDPMILIRVANTHMSLETLLSYLQNVDLSTTEKIMLIHLSERNSNEEKYIKAVQEQTGIETIAADTGVVVETLDSPGF